MDLDNSGSYRSLEILLCHREFSCSTSGTRPCLRRRGMMETSGDTPIVRSAVLITVTLSASMLVRAKEIGRELRRHVGNIPVWGAGVPIVDGPSPASANT